VRLHAVWLAESYPASYLESLLGNVRRLAPGTGGGFSQSARGVEWLEEALRTGGSGSSNLGPIVPRGSTDFAYAEPIEADLPNGVRYALAELDLFIPSHAVLVICFVLDENSSRRVEETLRADYRTHGVPHGRSISIHGPFDQKTRAARAQRHQKLAELGAFFAHELPGRFCANDAEPATLPSLEFWTTKEIKPFDEEHRDNAWDAMHSFIAAMAWRRSFDSWEVAKNVTLQHAPAGRERQRDARALQLVARERELFPDDDLQHSGGRTREGYVNRLSDGVNGLLAVWALSCTTQLYESELITLRQRLRQAQREKPRRRVRAIHDVQSQLLAERTDVESLARGIERTQESLLARFRMHSFDLSRWIPPHRRAGAVDAAAPEVSPRRRLVGIFRRTRQPLAPEPTRIVSTPYSWLELQNLGIRERAQNLVDTSRELTEVALAMIETAGVQANLQLQTRIRFLTWVLVILTAATLLVAILALR
jgi:hypothetical protein